jgi:membrane protease YdiL (CAAX protease family)
MHDAARKLRPVDGILIFGISYLVSTIVAVSLSEIISIRTGAVVSAAVLLGVGALLLKVAAGSYVRYVRIRRVRPAVMFYSALASVAVILPTLSLESVVVRYFRIPPELVEALIEMLRAESVPELVWVWVVTALGAALSEEFIFRGVLQNCLSQWTKGWVAIVITSLVFGILHTIWRLPPAFILGLLLGVLYLRTGSILPSILAHVIINSVSVLGVYLAENLGDRAVPAWLTEDESAPILIVGGSLAVFCLAMRLLWMATRAEQSDDPTSGSNQSLATGNPDTAHLP